MAIAIYQETATSRKQWADSTSLSTLRKLASGEWLLFDATPADPPPAADGLDAATAALLGNPASLTGAAGRAAFVPVWKGSEAIDVALNPFRLSPDGTIVKRGTSGTTRASWDATEQAAWTVTAGLGGGGSSYTDEQARDAVGAALRNGTGVNVTIDDAGDTITIAVVDASDSVKGVLRLAGALGGTAAEPTAFGLVSAAQLQEFAQDAAAALITAGIHSGMSWTYDDANNRLSGTVTAGGAASSYTRRFDPRDYGAKVDGIRITDAVTTAGAATLSSNSYSFTSADVGKLVGVEGAGVTSSLLNTVWQGTIVSVASGVATLDTNASTSVSAGRATFGTNDDAALLACHDAARTAGQFSVRGGTVLVPPGRMIVKNLLQRRSYVSFVGEGRELSIFCPITASGAWMDSDWAYTGTNPIVGIHDTGFAIEAGNMNSGASYSSGNKPYRMNNGLRCSTTRIAIFDSPATSIPWDFPQDVVVAFNHVANYGRTATPGVPGGSGIGVGIGATPNPEPISILANTVIGPGVATNSNYGIFVEAQGGTQATISAGARIQGNYIRGARVGIADSGSRGTIITGNILDTCATTGIIVNGGTLPAAYGGVDTLITGNMVINSQGATGYGIAIDASQSSRDNFLTVRVKVSNNYVTNGAGWGIGLIMHATADMDALIIESNEFRLNGKSGLYAYYSSSTTVKLLKNTVIRNNRFVSNGTAGASNDTYGMRFACQTTGLELVGNRCYDDQATKTQTLPARFVTYAHVGAVIRDNNFRGNTADTIGIAAGATFEATSIIERNLGHNPLGPVAATVGASPWTYAAGNAREILYLKGGTVTDVTKGGQSLGTPPVIELDANQSVVVTYSAAPTAVADRR